MLAFAAYTLILMIIFLMFFNVYFFLKKLGFFTTCVFCGLSPRFSLATDASFLPPSLRKLAYFEFIQELSCVGNKNSRDFPPRGPTYRAKLEL